MFVDEICLLPGDFLGKGSGDPVSFFTEGNGFEEAVLCDAEEDP